MNNRRKYIIEKEELRQSGITMVLVTTQYNLLDSFNDYPELTLSELATISDEEYNTRVNDFIDFIGTIDLDVKNILISGSTFFDLSCVIPLEVVNLSVECDEVPTTTEEPTTTVILDCEFTGGDVVIVTGETTTTTMTPPPSFTVYPFNFIADPCDNIGTITANPTEVWSSTDSIIVTSLLYTDVDKTELLGTWAYVYYNGVIYNLNTGELTSIEESCL